jgi:hypothetical protein
MPVILNEMTQEEMKRRFDKAIGDGALRICPSCGNNYSPIRMWQGFCSVACRNRYHREKAETDRENLRTHNATLKMDKDTLLAEVFLLRKQLSALQVQMAHYTQED